MTLYESVVLIGGVCAVLSLLSILSTAEHANQQRSVIEAKLDWVLSRQADHDTRLSVLESNWQNYDEHPSQQRRTT